MVGHVHAATTKFEHRRDIRHQRVADHDKRCGSNAELGEHARIGRRILFRDNLDALEQIAKARALDLGLLVDQVALGDEHDAVIRSECLDRFADTRQQFDRMGQHFLADADQSMQVAGTDQATGDIESRLDHRQGHALGAITEDVDIAGLDREQALVHARIGEIDIATDDALELGLRGVVEILALPQRVIAIEADQLNRHRALPQSAPVPAALPGPAGPSPGSMPASNR